MEGWEAIERIGAMEEPRTLSRPTMKVFCPPPGIYAHGGNRNHSVTADMLQVYDGEKAVDRYGWPPPRRTSVLMT